MIKEYVPPLKETRLYTEIKFFTKVQTENAPFILVSTFSLDGWTRTLYLVVLVDDNDTIPLFNVTYYRIVTCAKTQNGASDFRMCQSL